MARKKAKRKLKILFQSITAWLFITTQVAALLWVSLSYAIALYATVALEQPFPIESLSEKAINTLLGVTALKVVENVFEHNDGAFWGKSKSTEENEECEG